MTPALLTEDSKKNLERFILGAVEALRKVFSRSPLIDRIAYKYMLHTSTNLTSAPTVPVLKDLRALKEFQELLLFVGREPTLLSVIFGYSDEKIPDDLLESPLFEIYLEGVLLRIVSMIESAGQPFGTAFDNLLSFLETEKVSRHVHVPLMNLQVPHGTTAIHGLDGLGVLTSTSADTLGETHEAENGRSQRHSADLMFEVRTVHFMSARFFPLASEIKPRVTLLRLVVHPLISYNHFFFQHIQPWEQHIPDSELWDRFWAAPKLEFQIPCGKFETHHTSQLEELVEKFSAMSWDELSSWRLAASRLDDAVFKLECGSPDAILDLTIGLEAIYIESESRQESTHKIATRAARYLGETRESRERIFREVKEIYKARSTLAHGQRWKIDGDGVAHLLNAASLLAKSLKRMVEHRCLHIDLMGLDLN